MQKYTPLPLIDNLSSAGSPLTELTNQEQNSVPQKQVKHHDTKHQQVADFTPVIIKVKVGVQSCLWEFKDLTF